MAVSALLGGSTSWPGALIPNGSGTTCLFQEHGLHSAYISRLLDAEIIAALGGLCEYQFPGSFTEPMSGPS